MSKRKRPPSSESTSADGGFASIVELEPRQVIRQEFGRRLLQFMRERNWRQSDLAREAGLGRDSISQYVNGKSLPDSGNAQKLADAFGIDVQKVYPPRFMRASNQS